MKQVVNTPSVADAESALYASIRALVTSARSTIARGVDLVQVHTNFEIGRHMVEYEQQGEAPPTARKSPVFMPWARPTRGECCTSRSRFVKRVC